MKIARFLIAYASVGLIASSSVWTRHMLKEPVPTNPVSRAGGATPLFPTANYHGSKSAGSKQIPPQAHTQTASGLTLFWDNPTGGEYHAENKMDMENACREALQGEDCEKATIYTGSHREKLDGRMKRYFKVSVWANGDKSARGKIMRLYYDGTTRWHPKDATGKGYLYGDDVRQRLKRKNKLADTDYVDDPRRLKGPDKVAMDVSGATTTVLEPDASTKALTREDSGDNSELRIIWNPADAYTYESQLKTRRFFEDACRKALQGEKCKTATIFLGLHRQKSSGTLTKFLKVAVKQDGDAESDKGRILHLYTNGLFRWSAKDTEGKGMASLHGFISRRKHRLSKWLEPDAEMHTVLGPTRRESQVEPGTEMQSVPGVSRHESPLQLDGERQIVSGASRHDSEMQRDAEIQTVPSTSRHEFPFHGGESNTSTEGAYTGQAQTLRGGEDDHFGAYSGVNIAHWPTLGDTLKHYSMNMHGSSEYPEEDLNHLSPGGWWSE